jgi:hypothetical protein
MENYNGNRQENSAGGNWQERVSNEDRYRKGNDINMPSRYNRNEPYFGNLSDYEARGETRFPESGVNRDRRGLHSGKGPRSFQRSDERTRELVCERLSADPDVDAHEIEVEVNNQEVILSGSVPDHETKRRAADIADHIPGIANVENRIRVRQAEPGAQTDLRSKSEETFT